MGEQSKIQWTDDTWNPWRGCTKVSPGCANCYAEALSKRFHLGEYRRGVPRIRSKSFNAPLRWNKLPWVCDACGLAQGQPAKHGIDGESVEWCGGQNSPIGGHHRRRVFSLSLGDWLDNEVPIEWLADMLDVIRRCPNLDFLLLTKRPENWLRLVDAGVLAMLEMRKRPEDVDLRVWLWEWVDGKPPSNIWLGTSVENQEQAEQRIPALLKIPAKVRFLSMEPLLSAVDISAALLTKDGKHHWDKLPDRGDGLPYPWRGIDWVIVGCESGVNRRDGERYAERARGLREQCSQAGVRFFHKQMPINGRVSGDMAEWPEDLRVRQFPEVSR